MQNNILLYQERLSVSLALFKMGLFRALKGCWGQKVANVMKLGEEVP